MKNNIFPILNLVGLIVVIFLLLYQYYEKGTVATDGDFFISGYTTSDFDFNARVYKTDLNGFILPESDWE